MDRKSMVRTRANRLAANTASSNSNTNSNGPVTTRTRHKSGNASYADLITRAIMNSTENRLTLSEIYDWMVDNVPGLKDQRYLHSAKGWKNAVRHTLSINPRFRKMARLGRPGWWTVDPDFLRRTSISGPGVIVPPSTPPFATAAFIWDASPTGPRNGDQVQAAFRGRLASAPAVFLSPIFASSNTSASCCYSSNSTGQLMSRPPSSMSLMSASSTPIASPVSESVSVLSPPQIDGTMQTVQIWRDQGGVGLVSVPRPLPMRVASVAETGTQTDERNVSMDISDHAFSRFRSIDYFENVSPVDSPLMANLISPNMDQQMHQEQALITDQCNQRVSLTQMDDGHPILILTSMTGARNSQEIPAFSPASPSNGRAMHNRVVEDKLADLPEDLEGIDVDPNVRCDVVEVIKYEQNMNRIPKIECDWR